MRPKEVEKLIGSSNFVVDEKLYPIIYALSSYEFAPISNMAQKNSNFWRAAILCVGPDKKLSTIKLEGPQKYKYRACLLRKTGGFQPSSLSRELVQGERFQNSRVVVSSSTVMHIGAYNTLNSKKGFGEIVHTKFAAS